MIKVAVTILNKLGLHARASSKLIVLASKSNSNITIGCGSKVANAKSLMGVMMLAAKKGTQLELYIDGADEFIILTDIVKLINDRFGEAE